MVGPVLPEPSVGIYRAVSNFSKGATTSPFSYHLVIGTPDALEHFDSAVAGKLEYVPVSRHPASEFSPASGRCLRDFFSLTRNEREKQSGVMSFGKIGFDVLDDGRRRIGFAKDYYPKGTFFEPNLSIISRHSGLGSELEHRVWRDFIRWKKITHITTCVGAKKLLCKKPELVNDSNRHLLLLDPESAARTGQLENKGINLEDVLDAEVFCRKIKAPKIPKLPVKLSRNSVFYPPARKSLR